MTRQNTPPSQVEAFSTGYDLAVRTILRDDHSELTIRRCRRLWSEQREATDNQYVRWGLDGMLAALNHYQQKADPR
jgi:hypothetical protein